jgi:hypothetical protein
MEAHTKATHAKAKEADAKAKDFTRLQPQQIPSSEPTVKAEVNRDAAVFSSSSEVIELLSDDSGDEDMATAASRRPAKTGAATHFQPGVMNFPPAIDTMFNGNVATIPHWVTCNTLTETDICRSSASVEGLKLIWPAETPVPEASGGFFETMHGKKKQIKKTQSRVGRLAGVISIPVHVANHHIQRVLSTWASSRFFFAEDLLHAVHAGQRDGQAAVMAADDANVLQAIVDLNDRDNPFKERCLFAVGELVRFPPGTLLHARNDLDNTWENNAVFVDLKLHVYFRRALFGLSATPAIKTVLDALEPTATNARPWLPCRQVPPSIGIFARSPRPNGGSEKFDHSLPGLLWANESKGCDAKVHLPTAYEGAKVQLRDYQKETVNWMCSQENVSVEAGGGVPGLNGYFWERRSFPDNTGDEYFYFPLGGHVLLTPPPVVSGGMLCEEMGLGKTVEVIELVCSDAKSRDRETAANIAARAAAADVAAAKRVLATALGMEDAKWVGQQIAKLPAVVPADTTFKDGLLSQLAEYKLDELNWQIAKDAITGKMYYFHRTTHASKWRTPLQEFVVAQKTYFLDRAKQTAAVAPLQDVVPPSGGTLVVLPVSLLSQWNEEITSKAPHLTVAVYYGEQAQLYGNKRRTPSDLAGYDVVLTTMHKMNELTNRGLGGGAKILDKVRWHRLVVDECQFLKNDTTVIARAASSIEARHIWMLSGTPLTNKLDDLRGELSLLRVWPFTLGTNSDSEWQSWFWDQNVKGPWDERDKECLPVVHSLLSAISIRHSRLQTRVSDGSPLVDLPARTESFVAVREPSRSSESFINRWLEATAANLLDRFDRIDARVLGQIFQLRKVASCGALLDLKRVDAALDFLSREDLRASGPADEFRQLSVRAATLEFKRNAHLSTVILSELKSLQTGMPLSACSYCMGPRMRPVYLTCDHSLCARCCKSIVKPKTATLDCPSCRTTVPVCEVIEILPPAATSAATGAAPAPTNGSASSMPLDLTESENEQVNVLLRITAKKRDSTAPTDTTAVSAALSVAFDEVSFSVTHRAADTDFQTNTDLKHTLESLRTFPSPSVPGADVAVLRADYPRVPEVVVKHVLSCQRREEPSAKVKAVVDALKKIRFPTPPLPPLPSPPATATDPHQYHHQIHHHHHQLHHHQLHHRHHHHHHPVRVSRSEDRHIFIFHRRAQRDRACIEHHYLRRYNGNEWENEGPNGHAGHGATHW